MKVTGPGSGLTADAAAGFPEAPPASQSSDESHLLAVEHRTEGPEGPNRAESAGNLPATHSSNAGGVEATNFVAQVATDLDAGKLTAQAALDRVVEEILDRQVGAQAPAAVREQVAAALREALASDPMLVAKVKALGA